VTVDFATSNGTATAGSDYTAASGTLSFAPGETSKTITVLVKGDTLSEADETFVVDLSNASNAALADDHAVGAIRNDDASVSVSGASIVEGDSGDRQLVFTVSIEHASARAVTVDYATADGTATAGSDYDAASGTLSFAAGETTKTISIAVHGDTLDEDDETLLLNLSNPSVGAAVAVAQGTGTIIDDDEAPALSIADASVVEGDAGTVNLSFVVTLSAASGKSITVDFATADGTATAGSDYDAASGALTFAPGETSKTITVTIRGDVLVEPDETFLVQISDAVNATIAVSDAEGTIINDDTPEDPAPTVVSYVVDDGTVQRSRVKTLTVTFNEVVTIADGAFVVKDGDGSVIPATLATEIVSGRTGATLTFSGVSLNDGDYQLIILAEKITDSGGSYLNGDAHDDAIFDFYRFFGDLDGDRDVDGLDYFKLRDAVRLSEYLAYLDADGDGDIDAYDVAQFRLRYGRRLPS
jgi:hypothetical protein